MAVSPSTFDPRYLTESAFKAVIRGILPNMQTLTSFDREETQHPGIQIRCSENQEEITPGCGIFKQKVEVALNLKADKEEPADAMTQVQNVRQCFYRNDLDPSRPMVDFAKRLTNATAFPFTCMGVIPRGEGPVQPDDRIRVYSYNFVFEVHMTPLR